jgi:hypothetical protein
MKRTDAPKYAPSMKMARPVISRGLPGAAHA